MKEFLKETFRPPTEEERQAISRYHRQRAVVGLISMVVMLIVAASILLPRVLTNAQLSGTWIALEDYDDGFQPDDRYLEFKEGTCFLNGKRHGSLTHKNGSTVISVHAPAGSYDRFVTVSGDTLTMEYDLPKSSYLVSAGGDYAAYTSSLDPTSTAFVQSIVAQQQSEDRHVVDTYVRISKDCGLTKEEKDALY